jgi:hypothetical protein
LLSAASSSNSPRRPEKLSPLIVIWWLLAMYLIPEGFDFPI